MNNEMELIFFQHILLQNFWDWVLCWEKLKLVSEGKKHIVLKSRKSVVWGAFFTVLLLLLGLFIFPPWKTFPEKKKFQFSAFKAWQTFCHFIFFLQTNEIEKIVSGVRWAFLELSFQALWIFWCLKSVCTMFQFSLGVYCVVSKQKKQKFISF